MSEKKKQKEAEEILSEFQKTHDSSSEESNLEAPEPELKAPEPEPELKAPEPEPELKAPEPEPELKAPEPEPELKAPEPEPELKAPEPEPELKAPEPEPELKAPEPELEKPASSEESKSAPDQSSTEIEQAESHTREDDSMERNVIFVGTKPIMTYVTATLTQLASQPTVTIKARGKRITQAVDVSQMIVKRMNTVGYIINDVRISSDSLTSQDGRERNVSTIEIDVTKT